MNEIEIKRPFEISTSILKYKITLNDKTYELSNNQSIKIYTQEKECKVCVNTTKKEICTNLNFHEQHHSTLILKSKITNSKTLSLLLIPLSLLICANIINSEPLKSIAYLSVIISLISFLHIMFNKAKSVFIQK